MRHCRLPCELLIAGALVVLAAPAWAQTIELPERVQIEGLRITLADLAEIDAPEQRARRLGAIDVGPAPLPGGSRGLTVGYLKMRLRRCGIDCEALTFTGATRVEVARAAAPPEGGPRASAEGDATEDAPPPEPTVVKRGSRVRLSVVCGAVRIIAEATTLERGVVGSRARLRVEQTRETVVGQLTSATEAVIRRG
ncbi:MAG: hypothetical protein U9R79_16875 [Armatimonadota bacterium]|nr:hypothetical protein [Armatimonadota bacterium]